ncbi:thioredoxin [Bacteroides sp. 224]|uniref:thioredoxin n=1 Tax=Bacteroides sp. 224 TaxID=2302936 RepID=UPI0013D32B6E|nr:thioredoxin [Bacteroides sp. 224]NDV63976.1 thioredoxin [Bacteroides sp. 224]
MTINITDNNLKELIENSEALVVDFWAEWCGPCKMISPIVDELSEQYAGRVTVGKVNIENDDCQEIVAGNSIRSVPTILFFRKGELVDKHIGGGAKDILESKIKTCFNK